MKGEKEHILIVDDEPDIRDLLETRLNASGFEAHAVASGAEALKYVKQHSPNLMLLDMMMPEMSGYEVAEQVFKNNGQTALPIIMLTANTAQADKIKALTLGIDDYITKPYDEAELIARIQAVLRRTPSSKNSPEQDTPLSREDEQRLQLLKTMIEQKIEILTPQYQLHTPSGYGYPLAAEIFEVKDGSEVDHLEFLVEQQCLEKNFFDKILICPFCQNYNLNIRETCPQCQSPQLKSTVIVHHYRCAYQGPESEFLQGIHYVCPKCHQDLEHIGVDYDKPGTKYLCQNCNEGFVQGETCAQCRNCLKNFEIGQVMTQTIASYRRLTRAQEQVQLGHFGPKEEKTPLLKTEGGLYNLSYFRWRLKEEYERHQTFQRPFSLLLIRITNFAQLRSLHGEKSGNQLFEEIALRVRENLLKVDVPARYDENSFISLLPEADAKQAKEKTEKLLAALESFQEDPLRLSVQLATYPQNGKGEEALLEFLINSPAQFKSDDPIK